MSSNPYAPAPTLRINEEICAYLLTIVELDRVNDIIG